MKKMSLISLEKEELKDIELKAIKGGGVCACRHQGRQRADGAPRAEVKDMIDKYV